jgi:hypothetical protein
VSPHDIGRIAAAGRVLVGTALTLAPASGAGWIGEESGRSPVTVYSRALGIRDAAIGVGVITANDAERLRPWLIAGLASDIVDFAATLEARDDLPDLGRRAVPFIAGGSALLGAWLLTQLD